MSHQDHLLDRVSLRGACLDDVPELLDIKRELAFDEDACARGGGFLLGSSEVLYQALVQARQVTIACLGTRILGFGIGIEHEILLNSPFWARRTEIDWEPDFDVEHALSSRIGYLDQLAIRADVQRQWIGALIAGRIMNHFIATHHDTVFTTTLVEPIQNSASLPLIARTRGRRIGTLTEYYEGTGEVVSALHLLPPKGFLAMRDHLLAHGDPLERRVLGLAELG